MSILPIKVKWDGFWLQFKPECLIALCYNYNYNKYKF